MTKNDVIKMIGINSRQHLDFVLAGKRNFSYPVAKKATAVIGGTLGLWLDKDRAGERRGVWKKFYEAAKAASEEA